MKNLGENFAALSAPQSHVIGTCGVETHTESLSHTRRMAPYLAMYAIVAILFGCAEPTLTAAAPRPIELTTVSHDSTMPVSRFSGTVASRSSVSLSFPISGLVVTRRVDPGQTVIAGQVLATLEDGDLILLAQAAIAQRELIQAQAVRARGLIGTQAITQAELDSVEAQLRIAFANEKLANRRLSHAALLAPSAGVIGRATAEVGQYLAPGQTILTLDRTDEIEIAIHLPEAVINHVNLGDTATVELWNYHGHSYQGHVREISAAADPLSRSFAARVAIDAPDSHVNIGVTAWVQLHKQEPQKITVPLSAIFQSDATTSVWVVDEQHTVHLRAVTVELYRTTGAVVSSGLKEGERIVTAGVHLLHAGEQIQVALSLRKSES